MAASIPSSLILNVDDNAAGRYVKTRVLRISDGA